MGLRWKFNLVLALVLGIGMGLAGWAFHGRLQDDAREQVLREARLMMQAAMAVRSYTVDQVRPKLAGQAAAGFVPQVVPAYAAIETLALLQADYPDYSYREAVLNPTNPRDRAQDWEAQLVERFRGDTRLGEVVGERAAASGRTLYIARPIQVAQAACLQCHGTPAAAPPAMLRLYGERGGFGWTHGEVVGTQLVTVPMALPLAQAARAWQDFMAVLLALFAAVFITLNAMLSWLIVSPVRSLAQAADRISTGEFSLPEMQVHGHDEVAVLASSFNRLRRSLEKAIRLLDGAGPR